MVAQISRAPVELGGRSQVWATGVRTQRGGEPSAAPAVWLPVSTTAGRGPLQGWSGTDREGESREQCPVAIADSFTSVGKEWEAFP